MGDSVLNLTITPQPSVTLADIISSNGTSICLGSNTTLTASAATHSGTISYEWNASPDLSTTIGTSVLATPSDNATYTVVATAHTDGCDDATDSKSITLSVVAPPTVSLAAIADQTVCDGGSATFVASATASAGDVSYSWTNGANTPDITVSAAGTYTVTASATANGCTGTDSKTVTLSTTNADFTMNNILANGTATTATTVNANAALTLAANVSGTSTVSYAWSTSAAGGTDAGTSSSITPSTATAGTTTYYLRVTNTNAAGCTTYKDKTIAVTVQACNITSSLAFTSSSYSGGTNSAIPLEVSVTLNGASNGGYTWSIVSSSASGATLNNGTYSYQKNFTATGAGTATVKCVMHVTKDGCEKDVEATTTVTVTACSVTINSLSVSRGTTRDYAYPNTPFYIYPTYSVSPSNATLTWQWKGYSSTSSTATENSTYTSYLISNTQNTKYAFVLSPQNTTLYYGVTLTASYGGCSVSRTAISSFVLSTNVSYSSPTFTPTVTKSGKTLTIKGTNNYTTSAATMCAAVVPLSNTECIANSSGTITNPVYLYTTSTVAKNGGTGTITYTFPTQPTSGTTVRVYVWFSSSTGCSLGSYSRSAVRTTTVSF